MLSCLGDVSRPPPSRRSPSPRGRVRHRAPPRAGLAPIPLDGRAVGGRGRSSSGRAQDARRAPGPGPRPRSHPGVPPPAGRPRESSRPRFQGLCGTVRPLADRRGRAPPGQGHLPRGGRRRSGRSPPAFPVLAGRPHLPAHSLAGRPGRRPRPRPRRAPRGTTQPRLPIRTHEPPRRRQPGALGARARLRSRDPSGDGARRRPVAPREASSAGATDPWASSPSASAGSP